MLVPVITFDIVKRINYKGISAHLIQSYCVPCNTDFYDAIYALPFARNIEFAKMFEEQFNREERVPVEFAYLFATEEDELCPFDQMV